MNLKALLRNVRFWGCHCFQNSLSQRDQAILQENITCFLKGLILTVRPSLSLKNLFVNLRWQWWWGIFLKVCLLTPYAFLLPLPSAQLAHKILLVFWGRGRKALGLACPGFGSSCFIGHPRCIHCGRDMAVGRKAFSSAWSLHSLFFCRV